MLNVSVRWTDGCRFGCWQGTNIHSVRRKGVSWCQLSALFQISCFMTGFGHNCATSKVKKLWSTCCWQLTTGTAMDLVWLFSLSGQRCREAICYWFVLRSSLLYLLFLACFGMQINVFHFLFVDKTMELNHIKASLPVVWVRFNCHCHHSHSLRM